MPFSSKNWIGILRPAINEWRPNNNKIWAVLMSIARNFTPSRDCRYLPIKISNGNLMSSLRKSLIWWQNQRQSSSFFLVMDSLTFKTTRKWILDFLVPNTWARVGMIPDSFFHPYVSFQFFQYTTNRNGILYRINIWFGYIRINSVQFNKTKEYRTEAFLSNIFDFLKKKKILISVSVISV